jgi:hypothetical protein
MTVSRSIARWMMRLVVRYSPPAQHEWAVAMQREFEALDNSEFTWAIGCLTTAAGWKLRAEWLYLLLLGSAPLLVYGATQLTFDLLWYGLISRSAFTAFLRGYGVMAAVLTPLPLAFVLGLYRPQRIGTTVVFGCLAQHVVGTLIAIEMTGGSFLSWWGPNATLYMAPPLVGLIASIGVWYLGASLGATLRRDRFRA